MILIFVLVAVILGLLWVDRALLTKELKIALTDAISDLEGALGKVEVEAKLDVAKVAAYLKAKL
jgi:hypothetical protein